MKTVDISKIADRERMWDCIVVGAGPAGTIAAHHLARAGHKVVLVDKASFPRYKVCGCCINGAAQKVLAEIGGADILEKSGAVPLHELIMFDGAKRASIALPSGASLSRERFDMELINAATNSGSLFLPGSFAALTDVDEQFLSIKLTMANPVSNSDNRDIDPNQNVSIARTKVLIVADGLSGRSLQGHVEFDPILDGKSRFGAGVVLAEGPSYYELGKIYMACGSGGYVGLVRLEDERLDVAAAFDPAYTKDLGGPANAAEKILNDCGLPLPALLKSAQWTGTQLLSRRRSRVAGHRLFIAGDACGYPEPFTGEGIAWALQSGLMVAKLASKGILRWNTSLIDEWQSSHRQLGNQQLRSAMIALALRNSTMRHLLIRSISAFPSLASPVVQSISNARTST